MSINKSRQLSLWELDRNQSSMAPWEASLRKMEQEFIAKNRELIEEARRNVSHRPPLFSHSLGVYQQGIFKAGVREYFKETGQKMGTLYGYE